MRLALLIGARPSTLESGPKVHLPMGKWRITSNAKETHFDIECNPPSAHSGDHLNGPCLVNVKMIKKGAEPHLSIYAETF